MNLTDGTKDKYAEIDAELEAEFAAELEAEIEETDLEVKEIDQGNEQVEQVEQEDQVEQPEEEITPEVGEPSERIEDTPANRAFAEQRLRIKQLEEEQAKKDKIIQMVMQGSGLEDEEQFMQALEQAMAEQEKQTLKMDDQSYAALEKERREKQEYQRRLQEKEAQLQERNLFDFNDTLAKYQHEYGITRDEIFEALAQGGVTVDTIRASENHDLLIKTHMIDRIAEIKARRMFEAESKRGKVDSKKLSGPATDTGGLSFEEQQEALLEKDLQDYIKNKKW